MALRFLCFNCSARIKVPDGTQGRKVKCPSCGSLQRVPEPNAQPPDEPAVETPKPKAKPKPTPPVATPIESQDDVSSPSPVTDDTQADDRQSNQSRSSKKAKRDKQRHEADEADSVSLKSDDAKAAGSAAKSTKDGSAGYASSFRPPAPEPEPEPEEAPAPAPVPEPEPVEEISAPAPQAYEDEPLPLAQDHLTQESSDEGLDESEDVEHSSPDPLAALAAAAGEESNEPEPQAYDVQDDEPENAAEPAYELAEDPASDLQLSNEHDDVPNDQPPDEESDESDELDESEASDELEESQDQLSESREPVESALNQAMDDALASDNEATDEKPEQTDDESHTDESPALPWTDVKDAAFRQDHDDTEREAEARDRDGLRADHREDKRGDDTSAHGSIDKQVDKPAEEPAEEPPEEPAPVKAKASVAPPSPKAIPLGHASTFRSTMARPQPVPGVATERSSESQTVNQGLPEATMATNDAATGEASDIAPPDDDGGDIDDLSSGADDQSFDAFDPNELQAAGDESHETDVPQDDTHASQEAVAAASIPVAAVAGAAAGVAASGAGHSSVPPAYPTAHVKTPPYGTSAAEQSAGARPRGLYRSLKFAALLLRIVAGILLLLAVWQGVAAREMLPSRSDWLAYALLVCQPLAISAIAWAVAECCVAARELLRR